jgi:transmembrane protein 33
MAKKLQVWVKGQSLCSCFYTHAHRALANYDTAMKAVAFIELLIMVRVLLGAITFRNSLLTPIFYAHFLRQRYYQSNFTRQAVNYVNTRVEGFVRQPGANPMVIQVWDTFKGLLVRWGGSTLAPQQPAAGARAQ